MPVIKKPTPVKKPKKPATQALQAKNSKTKKAQSQNPAAYFGCMKACCQKGIKPKKITEIAQECKHNALTINAKMSAAKATAAKKIKVGYETMGQGLAELIEATK